MPVAPQPEAPPRRGLFGDFRPEVRSTLPSLVFYRFLSNVGARFPYSFLPALARGSGLSIDALGQVMFLRELTGATAPGVGRLADRFGSERVIVSTTVLGVIGFALGAIGATGLAIGLVIMGLAKISFDVASNAWIGDHVSYERRGRAMGLVEVTWAAAALIGSPILGLMIDHIGWWSASALLAVLSAPTAFRLAQAMNGEGRPHRGSLAAAAPRWTGPLVVTLVGFCGLTTASQFLIIGHGLWLDSVYGLSASGIGFAVMAVGSVEAVGSGTSARMADRWGKRNSVVIGATVMTAALVLLSIFPSPPLPMGLVLLAAAFLGFEFGLVSALPLLSELDPEARAQVLGWALGTSTVLRALASLSGVALFESSGFAPLTALAAVLAGSSALLLRGFGLEPK